MASPGSGPGGGHATGSSSFGPYAFGGSFGGRGGDVNAHTNLASAGLWRSGPGPGRRKRRRDRQAAQQPAAGEEPLKLARLGNLTLNTLSANGSPSPSSLGGGGAGGGILLHAGGIDSRFIAASGRSAAAVAPDPAAAAAGLPCWGCPVIHSDQPADCRVSTSTADRTRASAHGLAGVFTVGANSTVVPGGMSVTLDGNPVLSVPGSHNQTTATIEALIRARRDDQQRRQRHARQVRTR